MDIVDEVDGVSIFVHDVQLIRQKSETGDRSHSVNVSAAQPLGAEQFVGDA